MDYAEKKANSKQYAQKVLTEAHSFTVKGVKCCKEWVKGNRTTEGLREHFLLTGTFSFCIHQQKSEQKTLSGWMKKASNF